MPLQNSDVWFITGCSTGFGRELAKLVLDRGYRAVITARDTSKIRDLTAGHEGRALALKLDVTDKAEVAETVRYAESVFGSIDVLVNNAGFGYVGALEESDEDEVRALVETNFFGLARMIHVVLPGMRRRRRGNIVNMSSIGGLVGFPGVGYYNATKFAVEGLSESLAKEVAPLGIKVLVVEPGPFRTDWAGRSLKKSSQQIPEYAETAGAFRERITSRSGKQVGDPVRAGEAIIKALESDHAPLHLVLGLIALETARTKIEKLSGELDAWEETSLSADYPESHAATAS
ncbi:MAG TPA: oxidoreductase [Verrucomicrobiae bacterium]|nr:oxidoreductase [Verrucomicrobiae bacterium]